jgi:hypothetical protein
MSPKVDRLRLVPAEERDASSKIPTGGCSVVRTDCRSALG